MSEESIKKKMKEKHGQDVDVDVLAPEDEDEIRVIVWKDDELKEEMIFVKKEENE